MALGRGAQIMCLIVFDIYVCLITECWNQRKFGLQVLQHLFHVQGSKHKGFNPSFEKPTRERTCRRKSCLQVNLCQKHLFSNQLNNPQYDKRLFMDLPVQYMKTTSSEHVVYTNCFLFL